MRKIKMKSKLKVFSIVFVVVSSFISQSFATSPGLESSNEIGVTLSGYKYQELKDGYNNFMSIKSLNVGMDYIGTLMLDSHWFMRGDAIGVLSGNANYASDGSGTIDNVPNWYIDVRGLFGRGFDFNNFTLAPYIGIGYRYLYNDLLGGGAGGYTRESNYFYLPVGIMHEVNLSEQSKLITMLEFDYLISGTQDSGGIENKQDSGYGARLGCMYQYNNWSVGPYLTYWHISDSNWKIAGLVEKEGKLYQLLFQEPHNYTVEAGLKVSYRF
ncbi:MAG: hypothetical protein KKE11_04840 [Gammaproteobacteria bacterium]|nr:hypothetical protein [Gammaproteobacteria bacterium]